MISPSRKIRGGGAGAEGQHHLDALAADRPIALHVGVVHHRGWACRGHQASRDCRSNPAQSSVPRFGAVLTRPSRTAPGNPTDTLSKLGQLTGRGLDHLGDLVGGDRRGRGRDPHALADQFAAISSRASLIPVPPISTASERRSGMGEPLCGGRAAGRYSRGWNSAKRVFPPGPTRYWANTIPGQRGTEATRDRGNAGLGQRDNGIMRDWDNAIHRGSTVFCYQGVMRRLAILIAYLSRPARRRCRPGRSTCRRTSSRRGSPAKARRWRRVRCCGPTFISTSKRAGTSIGATPATPASRPRRIGACRPASRPARSNGRCRNGSSSATSPITATRRAST